MARQNRFRLVVGLLGLAGLLGAWGASARPAWAAVKRSDAVVKISATAGKPDADGNQVVTITLLMDKGWHTYANPVGDKDFEDNATKVEFTGKNKPDKVNVEYPKGTPFKVQGAGTLYVYEGKAVIKATVHRAKDSTGPLEVSVMINSCNDQSCLPPATVKLKVD